MMPSGRCEWSSGTQNTPTGSTSLRLTSCLVCAGDVPFHPQSIQAWPAQASHLVSWFWPFCFGGRGGRTALLQQPT